MKKKIIFSLILLILVISTTAILFNNKQEALQSFIAQEIEKEENITKMIIPITYTTDVVCEIISLNETDCNICFSYTLFGDDSESCIFIDEDMAEKEIDNKVDETVRNLARMYYPEEIVKYTKMNMEDRELYVELPLEQYYCSTKTERIETCICLSGTKRTCYYETCGSSPYSICTLGEWIKT